RSNLKFKDISLRPRGGSSGPAGRLRGGQQPLRRATVSLVFLRLSKLAVAAAVVALIAIAAVAAEPHRWSSRTCPPYCSPTFGYVPTTWRPWPTVCETPIESPSKSAQKEQPEFAPPPKEEAPEAKPPAPGVKPEASPPAQPPKKSTESKEQAVPKQEAHRDFPPSQSPYNAWNPSLGAATTMGRP